MVDRDLVLGKVRNIQNSLKRIRDATRLDPNQLENLDTQDIFVLNLQRAVQSATDLAAHVVASEGLGLPETLRDNFTLLRKHDIISADLTARMTSMVAFRNIAVHEYQQLDVAVLKSILQYHLKDLEEFYTRILKHYGF